MRINILTFLYIFIFYSLTNNTFCSQSINSISHEKYESQEFKEYYSFLISIKKLEPNDKIMSLQNFLKNHTDFDRVYLKLLECYIFQNKTSEAKFYFHQLLSHVKYQHNSQWMLGNINANNNNPAETYKYYFEAFSSNQPSILLLKDFITFHYKQSDKNKKSLNLNTLIKNPDKIKFAKALSKRKESNYKKASGLFSSISLNFRHHPEILHNWGSCFYYLKQYDKADSIWSIGLKLAKKNKDADYEAQFLIDRAFIKKKKFNYQEALAHFDSAYSIVNLTGNKYLLQLLKGNSANIYREKLSNNTLAAKLYNEAIEISLKLGIPRITCSWYQGYAASIFSLGRFNEAFEAYETAEKIATKVRNNFRLVTILLDKGTDYYYLKQNAIAKLIFLKALKLAKEKKLLYYTKYANAKLGNIYLAEGNHQKARDCFNEFIYYLKMNNRSSETYSWKARIARSYMIEKKYSLAQKEYDESYNIANTANKTSFMGWCLLFSGDIDVLFSNDELAFQKFKTVKEIANKQRIYEMLWQVYLSYGNAYKKNNNLEQAIAAYKQSINVFEKNRTNLNVDQLRIGYSSEGHIIYQNLIQCYYERYITEQNISDLDTLFNYQQLSRGRSLNELLLESKSKNYSQEYLQACNRLRTIQRKLRIEANNFQSYEKLPDLYSKLKSERYSLITQRLQTNSDENNNKNISKFPSRNTIQEKLVGTELGIIIYHTSDELSFAIVLTGRESSIVPLDLNLPVMSSIIDSLLNPFHNVKSDSIHKILFNTKIANRLYLDLFDPVKNLVSGFEKLIIIPDYLIMNLPFEMLLTKSAKYTNYSPLDFPDYAEDFLGNQFMFIYGSCISLINKIVKPASTIQNILAFANPISNNQYTNKKALLRSKIDWHFDPLPYAEIEVNKIKDIWPQTDINKRENATEFNFAKKSQNQKIIHFATHAYIDSSFDLFSGLVLSPGSDTTEDGMLMGYEIADIELNSDLVTLSACETGRGNNVIGEGIIGLPRLFLAAGANTVLMTLWKVDDKFTSTLMSEFYSNYLKNNAPIIDALYNAKRFILQNSKVGNRIYYQHPFYWASFTLYGNPGISKSPLQKSNTFILYIILIISFIILIFIFKKMKFNYKGKAL